MWIARDKNGSLWIYEHKPKRDGEMWILDSSTFFDSQIWQVNSEFRPFSIITWENSPVEVILKFEEILENKNERSEDGR